MRKMPPWPRLRTVILFFFALAGIAWETLFENSERPTLLILFAMMAGLPVFLPEDWYRRQPPKDEDKDDKGTK